MATFVKCKEEFVKYKTHKQIQTGSKTERFLLFFKTVEPIFEEVPDSEGSFQNNPINISRVLDIEKVTGAGDKNSSYGYVKGTSRPGIKFFFEGGYYTNWYYNSEKLRDEQFEEVATNKYKSVKGEF